MFYEDNNFIVAGAAVVGFVIGAVVMWIYRHFTEAKDLIDTKKRNDELWSDIHKLKEKVQEGQDRETVLIGDIMTMNQINPLLQSQVKQLAEAEKRTNEQVARFKYLAKIVGKLEIKRTVVEERENKAKNKAEKDAKKALKKDSDSDLDDFKKRSEDIPKKPKGPSK